MSATLTGAQILCRELMAAGVDVIFGYPGGAIMPLYDALYEHPVRHILTRHEAAAAFAASGYARTSGRVGVCCATSGPGATNLVTGLLDAMMDSVPVVAITGQVRTELMGTDGFQEADDPACDRSEERDDEKPAAKPVPDGLQREEPEGQDRGFESRRDHGTDGPGDDPDEDVIHAQEHLTLF